MESGSKRRPSIPLSTLADMKPVALSSFGRRVPVISVAKMLAAWLVTLLAMALLGGAANRRDGVLKLWDGILGFGVFVGLPMLLFALLVALPLSVILSHSAAPMVALLAYPLLLAGVAWSISALVFPAGWAGAQYALVLFALVLGLIWALLNLALPPSGSLN